MVDVDRWLFYKGACHVILIAKLHDCNFVFYKTDTYSTSCSADQDQMLQNVASDQDLHCLLK